MDPTIELSSPDPSLVDQRAILHGISWELYEAFLSSRGDSSALRIAYLKGELEIMTPSHSHEWIKTMLDRLLAAWAEETETELTAIGSWTVKSADEKRGVEADQSYIVGSTTMTAEHTGGRTAPDLAIEVAWSPGGLDKLDIYRGLGVKEVWIWRNGKIHVHVLGKAGYSARARSRLLPGLDLQLLGKYALATQQQKAVREFRQRVRKQLARDD